MLTWTFRALILATAAGLAACATPGAPGAAAAPAAQGQDLPERVQSGAPPRNRCDGQAAQAVVGDKLDGGTLMKALTAAGADEARLLHPDSIVTKEYKMGRVNVVVGENGRVSRVYCG